MKLSFLVIIGLLLGLGSGALAAPKAPASVLALITGSRDHQVLAFLVARFPYLQRLLANRDLTGTVFLPVDRTFYRGGTTSTSAVLASIRKELGPSEKPEDVNEALRWYWRSLNVLIVPSRKVEAASVTDNLLLNTTLEGVDGDTLRLLRRGSEVRVMNDFFFYEDRDNWAEAAKVLSSVSIGRRAVAHIVDKRIIPTIIDPSPGEIKGDLLKGNEPAGLQGTTVFTGPWEPSKEPMLTVFKPSDEALAAWLAANAARRVRPGTEEELFGDSSAVRAFVQAHTVLGAELWAWDLANLAFNGTVRNTTGPVVRLMDGRQATVTFRQAPTTGFHEIYLRVGSKFAKVTPLIDYGGNQLYHGYEGGYDDSSRGVMHVVSEVLMD